MFKRMKTLLSVSQDAKTIKGEKSGVLTGVLYLAPHNISGFQVCPNATEGCKAACLYTAGQGIYKNVQAGRINRTVWFFSERETFMQTMVDDITRVVNKAKRLNMEAAIRLNGTSDIGWEKMKCVKNGIEYASLMEAFPDIAFYEYTKILGRHKAIMLGNYHLTFSLAENNDSQALAALSQGYNVAVVMDTKPKDEKPKFWSGYPVINGDENDLRFKDPKGGHIVALTAKGSARKDTSGFVRSKTGKFNVLIDIRLAA